MSSELEELTRIVNALKDLLDDPQQGIASWWVALNNLINELNAVWEKH